jgi:Flp pilus assembly protein TadG
MTHNTACRRVGGNPCSARLRYPAQRGMVTVETAIAIVALLAVALLGTAAPVLVAAHIACADAARDAALALARDEPAAAATILATLAPPGAQLSVANQASTVEVTVRARIRPVPGPLGRGLGVTVRARSVALRESVGLR